MGRRTVRRWLALAWGIALPVIILSLLVDPPSDLTIIMNMVMVLVIGVVGSLIADRKPSNPIGWTFVGVFFITMVGQFQSIAIDFYLGSLGDGPSMPITTLAFINAFFEEVVSVAIWFCLLTIPVYYFPTGQLPSPRWRWVIRPVFAALILWTFVGAFRSDLPSTIVEDFLNPLSLPFARSLASALEAIMLVGAGIAPFSLIIRFWRSKGIERQQIKWPLFSALIGIITFALFSLASFLLPENTIDAANFEDSALGQGVLFLESLYLMSFPITVGIAILQHRLYDIDIIIRKTLQYTLTTAILALLYFGTVVGTQSLIHTITGQQSQVAIVLSTLAIAALFNPLRIQVQRFIDRRFYRTRYDTQQTLETFADSAREEVELEPLSRSLLSAVKKTMKPKRASLWLFDRESERSDAS